MTWHLVYTYTLFVHTSNFGLCKLRLNSFMEPINTIAMIVQVLAHGNNENFERLMGLELTPPYEEDALPNASRCSSTMWTRTYQHRLVSIVIIRCFCGKILWNTRFIRVIVGERYATGLHTWGFIHESMFSWSLLIACSVFCIIFEKFRLNLNPEVSYWFSFVSTMSITLLGNCLLIS